MIINIPVSVGELIDKITILEIKSEFCKNNSQAENINKELVYLRNRLKGAQVPDIYYNDLKLINKKLWDLEDLIRKHERLKNFNEEFILCARLIYMYNDVRSGIKKEINIIMNSEIIEEKIF